MIALLVREGIGSGRVGKNPGWKQEAELGRVNNQHFVQIPRARFLQMLEYKARLAGIRFIVEARELHQPSQLPRRGSHPHLRPEAGGRVRVQR